MEDVRVIHTLPKLFKIKRLKKYLTLRHKNGS